MSGEKSAPGLTRPLGRRRLTADEEHLWSVVARTIKPLRQAKKAAPALRHKTASPDPARPVRKRVAADPAVASPRPRPASAPPPISLARREKQQLARGHAAIDGRIDLHGMTQA